MAYDAQRFAERYGLTRLPAPLDEGWSIAEVRTDRVRAAVNLVLRHAEGGELLVFAEDRVDGAQCLVTTDALALSYYGEDGVDHRTAATVTRALAARLAEQERVGEPNERGLVVARRSVTGRVRTLELRINRECNEECVFCNTPESSETILDGPDAVLAALARGAEAGYTQVMLTGRETTLAPELPRYLRRAKELRYRVRCVQTNGTSFSNEPLLRSLVDAGMNATEMSLHTLDRGTFKALVGAPRLLDKTLEGLANLAKVKDRVQVRLVIVLTVLNLDHAAGVIERATAAHPSITQITLSPMAPVGDGQARVDLIPRPDALTAPLAAALDAAKRHRVDACVPSRCGAPLCVMPLGTAHLNAEMDNEPGQTLEASKRKPEQCARCVYDARCTGLWSACLDRWGDDVVRPVLEV
ncbi:MAG: radical SAM protein [Sandaracinaceae bacterium]